MTLYWKCHHGNRLNLFSPSSSIVQQPVWSNLSDLSPEQRKSKEFPSCRMAVVCFSPPIFCSLCIEQMECSLTEITYVLEMMAWSHFRGDVVMSCSMVCCFSSPVFCYARLVYDESRASLICLAKWELCLGTERAIGVEDRNLLKLCLVLCHWDYSSLFSKERYLWDSDGMTPGCPFPCLRAMALY